MADAFSLNTAMRFLRGESERLGQAFDPYLFSPCKLSSSNIGGRKVFAINRPLSGSG